MKRCDETIRKTLELTESMLSLAEEGDAVREDNNCGILYSVVRDSAYRIRQLAEAEKAAHVKKGWWKESRHLKKPVTFRFERS
ncbi:MAG: hypothetical protein JXL84_24700 [Deltaproteobacteria bacterium]|nr:hypothetical protein [Deltaproteobacteria bacterium]